MSERLYSHCQMRGWILCNGKSLTQLLPRNADVPVSSPLLLLANSQWLRWCQLRDTEVTKSDESSWFPLKSEAAPCRAAL